MDRQATIDALSGVYRVIVASAPLLEFAIEHSDGDLRDYYTKHLEEERGHDLMLLDDLKRLGVDEVPRSHIAARIAGSQYYLIAHEHPALLLGYMHALEKSPLPVERVDELSRVCGTELSALRHHAIHDPAHKEELEEVIDRLPQKLKSLVEWNERNVAEML